jgi:ribonuclease HI
MHIYVDGGARGNPGPGAWGVVIESAVTNTTISGFEPHATNNEMEWTAMLEALKYLQLEQPKLAVIHSDSLLVVKQLTDEWKTKDERMKAFRAEAQKILEGLCECKVSIKHIPRTRNKNADFLVNTVLDEHAQRHD